MPESLKARTRNLCNRLLHPAGLHLVRREQAFEMRDLLERSAQRGTNVSTWIDIGASDGSWSVLAKKSFPKAEFLLFEPLTERRPALEKLKHENNFHIVPAAAGRATGEISFAVDAGLDGSGVALPGAAATRQVPVETIDDAVKRHQLPGPYGIKLDTHGYELPVLEGATATLAATSLLIVEAYNFQLTPDCLRFHELCAWMETRGFRCCDLASPMRRPSDGLFWQMDLAFIPAQSPLLVSNRYD